MQTLGYTQIAFLPWISFPKQYSIANIRLVPFLDENGNASAGLEGLESDLKLILSGYVDIKGKPLANCTVVCVGEGPRDWDIADEDFARVKETIHLFMLCSFAKNEYFGSLGSYVNSAAFHVKAPDGR